MGERRNSPLRRAAGFLLTTTLVGIAIYTWRTKVADQGVLVLLLAGIVLGVVYTVRGGSLPPWLKRLGGGSKITADDDPRNLSPKVYLPVLMFVVVVALLLYHHYTGGGHRR